MKTINELTTIASGGEIAQAQLNSIVENIVDVYMKEIETQRENLEKDFPAFDEMISNFERGHFVFCRYRLTNDSILLVAEENFRGETNTEYDSLPIGVFVDNVDERNRLIKEFVSEKVDAIRNSLTAQQKKEDETARQQYESLKERFETT